MFAMTGNENGKRRAVVILHPDFDKPGRDGIQTAADFAKELADSQRAFVMEAAKTQKKEVIDALKKHVGELIIIVRSIPDELL